MSKPMKIVVSMEPTTLNEAEFADEVMTAVGALVAKHLGVFVDHGEVRTAGRMGKGRAWAVGQLERRATGEVSIAGAAIPSIITLPSHD